MRKQLFCLFLLFGFFSFHSVASAAVSDVVVNEIYYQGDNKVEWVELYNKGADSVQLENWIITDNTSSDTLPFAIISPGGFAVIITNNSTVNSIPSSTTKIQLDNATIGNGLSNDGDKFILKNSSGTEIDTLSYGSNTSIFSLAAVIANHSLERTPAGIDTNSSNDFIDQQSPTIGIGIAYVTPTLTPTPTLVSTVTPAHSPTPTKIPTPTKVPTSIKAPTLSPTKTVVENVVSIKSNHSGASADLAKEQTILSSNTTESAETIPTSILGEATSSAVISEKPHETSTPTAIAQFLGISQSDISLGLIVIGGFFMLGCGILVFLKYGKTENTEDI